MTDILMLKLSRYHIKKTNAIRSLLNKSKIFMIRKKFPIKNKKISKKRAQKLAEKGVRSSEKIFQLKL